jgi:hypothetical protein
MCQWSLVQISDGKVLYLLGEALFYRGTLLGCNEEHAFVLFQQAAALGYHTAMGMYEEGA